MPTVRAANEVISAGIMMTPGSAEPAELRRDMTVAGINTGGAALHLGKFFVGNALSEVIFEMDF